MKKTYFFFAFIVLSLGLISCFKNEKGDKEKTVVMTIYPETGYGTGIMSDIWTQPLIFSESDDNRKRILVDIITDGFNFEYERGYIFTILAKKIWMHEPPQDVSSIKYSFISLISKKKVITKDSAENIELFVSSETVKFTPRYPSEYETNESPRIYNALYVKKTGTYDWMALKNIEGFDFEEGYEYILNVKKMTQAEPYSIRYILLNIKSKTPKE
jgi:hypothetical protein